MQPIDLIKFADHSVKIPEGMLHNVPVRREIKTWKIVLAYWLDLSIIFAVNGMVNILVSNFRADLFTSETLQKAGDGGFASTLSTFTLLLWGYFFFSYFLNHGQTAGLLAIKQRIQMKEKSFRAALRWSLISSMTCFTGGFAAYFSNLNRDIVDQDYLYHELLTEKEIPSINLLEKTVSNEKVPEKYVQAA